MSDVNTWDPADSANTAAPPDGWPEFMMPSMVNNTGRMMMGAVRRMYDGLAAGSLVLPYLKLSGGGTVTGAVTVTGAFIGGAITSTTNIHSTANITAAGTISTSGLVSGLDVTATRNMSVAGTLYGGVLSGSNVAATGGITAGGSITATLDVTANRNMSVTGSLFAGGTVQGSVIASTGPVTGTSLELPGGQQRLHLDASFQYHTYVTNFYWAFDRANGTLYWAGSNSPNWVMRNTDGVTYNDKSYVAGHGDYANISDRRFKDAATIAPTTVGLPEVLQLQPVEFQRLPTETVPTPVWELGFVAQDVATVIPQAVNAVGVPLPDGSGGLESTEPTLAVTSGAIVAALVNCIKQIDARLTALEGGGE